MAEQMRQNLTVRGQFANRLKNWFLINVGDIRNEK